ncbi:hypothetical protein [Sediminitomix flava]|uniref:DUF2116 family Zn-ribbon domain-containing protein n=1 Tax=Sediminitomix flava TaxID=379075 RepID=A0A315YYC0_SEDFL|nr:hypothetical protein [Sediminitomix flava]PWJ35047.1 hypothetical protein BC781_11088 [Sediminitomix flava]
MIDQSPSNCLCCGKVLTGRKGKKYCDQYCKSRHQYERRLEDTPSIYFLVDKKLRKNRSILKVYNKAGKSTVRKETLIAEGFDPNFFTHYWKNKKGDVYLFVYEYGFNKKIEHQKEKYVLVQWQEYMNPSLKLT